FPIRSWHNNRPPHPLHCLQGPWLLGQLSQKLAHRVTSAENQKESREAICGLNDFTARKDYVRTRTRREPIAHSTRASSRCCPIVHSRLRIVRGNGIHKQKGMPNNSTEHRRKLRPRCAQREWSMIIS